MNRPTYITIIVLLVGVLLGSLYFLYASWLQATVPFLNITLQGYNDMLNLSGSAQFYPNMRYAEKEISYGFEDACSQIKKDNVRTAFDILEGKTSLVFSESSSAQITFVCSELPPDPKRSAHFVAGEGGPTEIVNTSLFSVIMAGKVSLYKDEQCGQPLISLHEILHALGFDHNKNQRSILYPTLSNSCNQQLDDAIVDKINELYDYESIPDFKIESIDASKGGALFNFQIKVVNRGLASAENVNLKLSSNGKEIETFDLGEMEIGTRKIFNVTSLRVPLRAKSFTFQVDSENEIRELYEDNNEIKIDVN